MILSRGKIVAAAKELADHLQIVEHVKALQQGQKELADALKETNERLRELESALKVVKLETKFESLKETQSIVNAVQGGLNQRIEDVAVKLALMERNFEINREGISRPPINVLPHDSRKDNSAT